MTPDAARIARQLAELLAASKQIDRPQSISRRPGLPDELYCDTLPDPDDPMSWVNGHFPRQAPTFRADQGKLDQERARWAPIIREAAARYGGARRLKARRR